MGGTGDDTFIGNAGNDEFHDYGEGTDRWTGGSGADTFHITTGNGGSVKITDFQSGVDKLFVNGVQKFSDADWLFT